MKRLFVNLMLVAVAAMTFASCSNEPLEVSQVENRNIRSFRATIANDQTRSGFVDKEEGATAYKSEWFGDEKLMVLVSNYDGSSYESTTTIDKEGKFNVDLTGVSDYDYFDIFAFSPAESWSMPGRYNLPTEQTPLANSVDPKAHLLSGFYAPYNNYEPIVTMKHMIGYGKMTINAGDFEIDHVVLKLTEHDPAFGNTNYTYTINADNVVNNTFWFAAEPMEVSQFTVTAYDAEGNMMSKSVDVVAAERKLNFKIGRVSTFSVSGLESTKMPTFTNAVWTNPDNVETKSIIFSSDEVGTLHLEFFGCNSDNYLDIRSYDFSGYGNIYSAHFTRHDGYQCHIKYGNVVVSLVDGEYYIEFNDLANADQSFTLTAIFKGEIENMALTDTRTRLPKPNVKATVDGIVITLSWDPVEGADEYLIQGVSSVEIMAPFSTTDTSVTIDAEWGTSYEFSVTAIALDTNLDYKSSDPCYVYTSIDYAPGQSIDNAFTFTNYSTYMNHGFPVMCLSGAENNAEFKLESGDQYGYPVGPWSLQSKEWNAVYYTCEYTIDGVEQELNLENSYTWLEGDNYNGFKVKYIYLETKDGKGLYYKYNGIMNYK